MPTTRTTTVTLYSFDELSEKAQQSALLRLWDLNVDYGWWDLTYADAENIGITITSFDIDRNDINGNWSGSLPDIAFTVLAEHGQLCDTYQTAQRHLALYRAAAEQWQRETAKDRSESLSGDELLSEYSCEDEAAELCQDFCRELLQDYLVLLRSEYDYRTSEEQVRESIRANNYEFTEDGRMA